MPKSRWIQKCFATSLGLFVDCVALTAASAEGSTEPVDLSYRAAAPCPSLSEFLSEVRRSAPRLRLAAPSESARRFDVTIEGAGLIGRLTIEGGAQGVREARGANCAEVSRLLAFAMALAVDADALSPQKGDATSARPPVLEPARILRKGSAEQGDIEHQSSTRRVRWALGAFGEAEGGSSPSVSLGGGLFAEAIVSSVQFAPSLRLGAGYGQSTPTTVNSAHVAFRSFSAWLEACPVTLGSNPVSFRPCLRVEGGAHRTTGSDIAYGHSATRPALSVGVAGHLRWRFVAPFFGELGGGLLFPTVRDTIFLQPAITVYAVPWAQGFGEFSLGIEFR